MPIKEVQEGGKKPRATKKDKKAFAANVRVLGDLIGSGLLPQPLKEIFTVAAIDNQKLAGTSETIEYIDDITLHLGENTEFAKRQPKAAFFKNGYKRAEIYESTGMNKKMKKVFYIKNKTDDKEIVNNIVKNFSIIVECNPFIFGKEVTELLSRQIRLTEK